VLTPVYDERGATGQVLAEQTTYLEWRNSSFADAPSQKELSERTSISCQGCHMPLLDDDGQAIRTVISTRPPEGLRPVPLPRHHLSGGSAYLLDRLAADPGWLGVPVTSSALAAAAARSRTLLASAASLRLERSARRSDELLVTVHNHSGHKLPTGYPSRRMWLHVLIEDRAGSRLFESGAHRAGALIDAAGRRLDGAGVILPHRDRLEALGPGAAPAAVVVWEAVPVDAAGRRTHALTGAVRFGKDDRILPLGWRANHPDAALAAPIGLEGDLDFAAGQDTVTIALPPGAARVTVELLYQAITPETIESYHASDGAEARRFLAVTAVAPEPQLLSGASWTADAAGPPPTAPPSPASAKRTATAR
jgi:hypothetical protein